MRTTLDIDDDVLRAAKALAEARKSSAGKVISELARLGLQGKPARLRMRGGIELLTGGAPVTPADVNALLDES